MWACQQGTFSSFGTWFLAVRALIFDKFALDLIHSFCKKSLKPIPWYGWQPRWPIVFAVLVSSTFWKGNFLISCSTFSIEKFEGYSLLLYDCCWFSISSAGIFVRIKYFPSWDFPFSWSKMGKNVESRKWAGILRTISSTRVFIKMKKRWRFLTWILRWSSRELGKVK